jgi:ribosomal protein S6-L-glutamate ligase RimK-like protein
VKSVNFFFMLARRTPDVPSQIILEVSKILRRRGHGIACSIVEESLASLHNLPLGHDLYLLKSYTELSLSLAGALDACGAHLINPYAGCVAARNKIVCYQILREAGVPVPKAWITSDPGLLKELVQECPLIVKPYMGWRGEGIQLVRNERERAALAPFNTPALIQEYVENDGEDLRLYVAGKYSEFASVSPAAVLPRMVNRFPHRQRSAISHCVVAMRLDYDCMGSTSSKAGMAPKLWT